MSKKILLADDSVTIQKVVELTFMDGDYEVDAVSDGDEALSRLSEGGWDLVVADVHMPGASGYEVARAAKEARPGTPVLLLVGTFESFDEEEAAASGADSHLKKPFDSQELMRLVEELAARAPEVAADSSSEETTQVIPPIGETEDEEVAPVPVSVDDSADGDFESEVLAPDAGPDPGPVAEEGEALSLEEELANIDLSIGDEIEAPTGGDESLVAPSATSDPEEVETAPEAAPETPVAEASAPRGVDLSDDDVDRIARRIVEILGDRAVREVAWEVIPDMAELVVKDRLRELEREIDEGGDD